MQPQQQPFSTGPEPRARMPRWLSWLVIGIIVIAVVGGVIVFAVIPYFQQPKITLTNATHTTAGCGAFGPARWTYAWTFTLVNTGDANGFATVEFYLNGQPDIGTFTTITYLVPHGSQVTEQASVQTTDCGSYSPGATIFSVVKA